MDVSIGIEYDCNRIYRKNILPVLIKFSLILTYGFL